VTSSTLSAIAPDLPSQNSSTGTSYYVQQRTALFAKIAFVASSVGLLTLTTADVLKHRPERILSLVYLCFVIPCVLLHGLWLFTRGKPRPLSTVRLIEIVAVASGLIAASFGFRLSTPGLFAGVISSGTNGSNAMLTQDPAAIHVLFEFCGLTLSLLVGTQILTIRAALVPSTLKHSIILAAVVGFPVCIFAGLGLPAMLPSTLQMAAEHRGFLITFGINWWLFTGAACAVIARVVHRLQSEVQVAKRLGQYELGEKIGQGGMGVVYRARHAMMNRPVAIKLLPAEAAGQDAVARFEREVQLTSQLSHPNTVVIHDYGRTHEGTFYYVMEYIDGATLEQVCLASGQMPSGRVVHILEMVAGALAEAHDHGLIHRDIKPANILLGPRGGEPEVAKVLDFGLVRAVRTKSEVTHAGHMMGTPLFMSPESMKNSDHMDGRSDLYSLSAVAYYLLSGHYVFQGESALEICGQHLHSMPRPLSGLVPAIDPELEKIVMTGLAKDPVDRPASAHALCAALARCPSRGTWTDEMARSWWEMHKRLLQPRRPSQTFITGEISGAMTESRTLIDERRPPLEAGRGNRE
jgi:serine/threonine-protein kinase